MVPLDANSCVLPCVSRDPLPRIPYPLPIFQEPGPTAGRDLGHPELGLGASALAGSACPLAWMGIHGNQDAIPKLPGPSWSRLCFVLLDLLISFCFPSLRPVRLCKFGFCPKSRCFHRKRGTPTAVGEEWQRPVYFKFGSCSFFTETGRGYRGNAISRWFRGL